MVPASDAITTITEFVMEADMEATPSTNDEDQHPWPYLKDMFKYVGVNDSSTSYRMKCLSCLPKEIEILSFKTSPSNLRKHIEVS